MDHPKAHDGFFFAPAAYFKVVVDGSHFEDTATEQVAADDLNNNTAKLNIENEGK
jgi:hypothetical protein